MIAIFVPQIFFPIRFPFSKVVLHQGLTASGNTMAVSISYTIQVASFVFNQS